MNYQEGQKVEFTYNGSQEEFLGKRVIGTVRLVPEFDWEGGSVPGTEDRGYAIDTVVLEDK